MTKDNQKDHKMHAAKPERGLCGLTGLVLYHWILATLCLFVACVTTHWSRTDAGQPYKVCVTHSEWI